MLRAWVLVCVLFGTVVGLDNGAGRKPAMGFNTWNHFHCSISEDLIKEVADHFVSLGLHAAGYEYVNLDDCWATPTRGPHGLVPDPSKFPHGMASLAEYVHSKGLKFGIYSSASSVTCLRRASSLYHEVEDATLFASWGVDYVKYDMCSEQAYDAMVRNSIMRDALNATGRPMYYQFGPRMQVPDPEAAAVGNAWRSTGDIGARWSSVVTNLERNNQFAGIQEIGAWNDADMLEIGNGHFTEDEERSHFAMWCMIKSPLILGNDIRSMPNTSLATVKNAALIAVNQDPLGKQAILLSSTFSQTTVSSILTAACSPYEETQRGWRYDSSTKQIRKGNRCLTVSGTVVELTGCATNGSTAQQWNVSNPTSLSLVQSVSSGKCLTVSNTQETGSVTLSPCAAPAPCTERFTCVYNPLQMFWFSGPGQGRQLMGSTYTNYGGHPDDITAKVKQMPQRQCVSGRVSGDLQVWGGPLSGGDVVVGLFNTGESTAKMIATWVDVEAYVRKGVSYRATDLYKNHIVGTLTATTPLTVQVGPHGVAPLRLVPT